MNEPTHGDPRQRLRELAISERGFVFDPSSGATFTVNDAGASMLRCLVAEHSRAEILSTIADRFEVEGKDLERDLSEFVLLLRQHGLVPETFTV